ncbi:SDR family NAD(P)-dependent oxidoreductase [Fulvivirga lutea]|uniref:SDR family NAD(P)-dependent oxidoreductase n=1 Tax=Fulvivirga lutea TaxID=2810512 RepID=A0A975A2G0_9BACT|nr:SDR family NAD(P)-dependent oxidoreductase [Fulvivirga lutea]QSE98801.1 SDR family NAD(P)-dependent oxidoreductase [Fulvivirga lutea]
MKTGIVTGANRGIGKATFKYLADRNYNVIGTARNVDVTQKLDNTKWYQLDLAEPNSIHALTQKLQSEKIDFIINNAGILLEQWDNTNINLQQLRDTFNVNVFGTIELTEKLLPYLNMGGHIINISSAWGSFSDPYFDEFQPHYKMSKAALNMYTKLLANRLRPNNIKVSALDPGWTQTDMGGANASRKPDEVAKEIFELLEGNLKTGKFWHRGTIREW